MYRPFVIAFLAFVAGTVATYFVVVIATVFAWDLLGVHDQDGGGAMALGLVIGPIAAVIGGIVCAVVVPTWVNSRRADRGPATPREKSRDKAMIITAAAAILGGFLAQKLMTLLFWVLRPDSIDTAWKVLLVTWAPTVAILIGVLAGGWIARRMMRAGRTNPPVHGPDPS